MRAKKIFFSIFLSSASVVIAIPGNNSDTITKTKTSTVHPIKYDLKIRVVDTNQLAAKTQQGMEGRNRLEQKQLQLRQELQAQGQNVEKEAMAFNSKKTTLSEDARNKEQTKLIRMRRDYENKVQTSDDELKLAAAQEQESLVRSIVDSAKEYAIEHKVDLVVDKGSGSVIYNSQKADCTADIINVMYKQYDCKIQLAKNKKNETTQLVENKTGKKAAT